ncbi:MAG: hypothetical protein WA874_13695 [Chryseosolibacter sp.]
MNFGIPILLLWSAAATAQDTIPERLQFNGYIKDLQSLTYQEDFTNLITGNLLHNRLNFKWIPSPRITAAAEFRNRLFWGEEVSLTPLFSSQLRNDNEAFDLSANWIDEPRMVFNTNIDRLWVDYHHEQWSLRLGRQRINWGIGTTWNPNDLFNTFNFLDFDYEERPGADAVKLQYLTGDMNHIEFAFFVSEKKRKEIAALKYFMNVANYDFQFIAGWYQEQPTLGMGWSGSIKETGFKGEVQYYFLRGVHREQLNLSVEADHMFTDGWYVSAGVLLNSLGQDESPMVWEVASLQISPRNLMPTKWNTVLTINKEITPLIAVNTTAIYTPGTNLLILLPYFSFSLTENVGVNLVWQSFFGEGLAGFDDISHRAFLRIKWNF